MSVYDLERIYKVAPAHIFNIITTFSDHYGRIVLTPIMVNENEEKCTFLEGNKCVLHKIAKPLPCQRYPFTFILEETVKEKGLIPPEDALKETIYLLGNVFNGYVMHPKTCRGVKSDEGEKVDGKKIVSLTLKSALEHLETINLDLEGILKKLQYETKKRLEFLDNFAKTAILRKIEILLPESSNFIGGTIAFDKEVLGENYLPLISSIATQLNKELSIENTKALATILPVVEAERKREKEDTDVNLKIFKTLIFGIFQSKKKDEKRETEPIILNKITVNQLIELINKIGISEKLRKEKRIKFLKQIIPVNEKNLPLIQTLKISL